MKQLKRWWSVQHRKTGQLMLKDLDDSGAVVMEKSLVRAKAWIDRLDDPVWAGNIDDWRVVELVVVK